MSGIFSVGVWYNTWFPVSRGMIVSCNLCLRRYNALPSVSELALEDYIEAAESCP